MDPAVLESLLKAIRDAVAGNRSEDDVVLPPFDPEKNDNGAEGWCNNIDIVARDRGWSGITTVSKAVAAGDKEQLAGLVRGYPVLYNTHHAHFRDKAQRRYAWQDISMRMLRPDSECIAIWKLLKSNYSEALRMRIRKMEQGLNVKSSKYENFMSFVKPYLKVCKNAPPTATATSEAPCAGSAPAPEWGCDVSRGELSPARSGNVPALPAQPQRNIIVELFPLGETVKDFPKDVKVRVKSEDLKIVSDAREFILSNNKVEQLFVVDDTVVKEEPLELQ